MRFVGALPCPYNNPLTRTLSPYEGARVFVFRLGRSLALQKPAQAGFVRMRTALADIIKKTKISIRLKSFPNKRSPPSRTVEALPCPYNNPLTRTLSPPIGGEGFF